jgi:hypothetical protein
MKELGEENRTLSPAFGPLKDQRTTVSLAMRKRIRGWLVSRIRARSDRLFHNLDEQARQHGWNMETGPFGLSRSYRDPRFDALRAQPDLSPAGADDTAERGAGSRRATGERQP